MASRTPRCARCRGSPQQRDGWTLADRALLAAAIGYGVQRDYLRGRYGPSSGLPGYGLEPAYAWAREVSGARIGLAGTAAGFSGYGFYGADLSNRVRYLGQEGPRGAFNPIPDCRAFRAAVEEADLDYLVTSQFLVRGQLLLSPRGALAARGAGGRANRRKWGCHRLAGNQVVPIYAHRHPDSNPWRRSASTIPKLAIASRARTAAQLSGR